MPGGRRPPSPPLAPGTSSSRDPRRRFGLAVFSPHSFPHVLGAGSRGNPMGLDRTRTWIAGTSLLLLGCAGSNLDEVGPVPSAASGGALRFVELGQIVRNDVPGCP